MSKRLSTYSITVPIDEERNLLINSHTGSIDEVDGDLIVRLKNGSLVEDEESYLQHRGHLTSFTKEAEVNNALNTYRALDRMARSKAAIVICPSMDCNFRCTYCFERPLQDRIDGDQLSKPSLNLSSMQVERIFATFPALIQAHGSLRDNITLFGGEPLWSVNYDVVEQIVQKATEHNLSVSAISNGYELSAFSKLLGKNRIKSVQVSLDGTRELHDAKRVAVGGGPTFDKILEEIDKVIDIDGLNIQIRCNYDSSNLSQIPELVTYLKNRGILDRPNVSFHGNLISMNHAHKGKDYSTLNDIKSVSQQSDNHELDCFTNGLRRDLITSLESEEPFRRRAHYCSATTGMYVFCPDNNIYACWEGIGESHSWLGTYVPELQIDEKAAAVWHRRNALAIPQCQSCSYLFFCSGGCAVHAFQRTGNFNVSECDGFQKKFNLMVKNYFIQDKNSQLAGCCGTSLCDAE